MKKIFFTLSLLVLLACSAWALPFTKQSSDSSGLDRQENTFKKSISKVETADNGITRTTAIEKIANNKKLSTAEAQALVGTYEQLLNGIHPFVDVGLAIKPVKDETPLFGVSLLGGVRFQEHLRVSAGMDYYMDPKASGFANNSSFRIMAGFEL